MPLRGICDWGTDQKKGGGGGICDWGTDQKGGGGFSFPSTDEEGGGYASILARSLS